MCTGSHKCIETSWFQLFRNTPGGAPCSEGCWPTHLCVVLRHFKVNVVPLFIHHIDFLVQLFADILWVKAVCVECFEVNCQWTCASMQLWWRKTWKSVAREPFKLHPGRQQKLPLSLSCHWEVCRVYLTSLFKSRSNTWWLPVAPAATCLTFAAAGLFQPEFSLALPS